jgi:hypothetical protein
MLELSDIQLTIFVLVRQIKLRFHKADKFVLADF